MYTVVHPNKNITKINTDNKVFIIILLFVNELNALCVLIVRNRTKKHSTNTWLVTLYDEISKIIHNTRLCFTIQLNNARDKYLVHLKAAISILFLCSYVLIMVV